MEKVKEISLRLLEPYDLGENSPYLSEDQLELTRLSFSERSAWMAEWLMLASQCEDPEEDDED
jgi:hypothetical protein